MISPLLIIVSAILTAAGVAAAARYSRWTIRESLPASIGALLGVVVWRLIANLLSLNDDFIPLVSVGDVGCLLVGAAVPAIVAVGVTTHRWFPVFAGGVVAFTVNVIIL